MQTIPRTENPDNPINQDPVLSPLAHGPSREHTITPSSQYKCPEFVFSLIHRIHPYITTLLFFFVLSYRAVNSRETGWDEEQGQTGHFHFMCQSMVSQMAVMPVPIPSRVSHFPLNISLFIYQTV